MNIESGERFEAKERDLEELILKIKSKSFEDEPMLDFDRKLFDKCIAKWKEYRELHAKYKASCVAGGSMYPLVYSQDLSLITEQKIESLKNEFESVLNGKRLELFH